MTLKYLKKISYGIFRFSSFRSYLDKNNQFFLLLEKKKKQMKDAQDDFPPQKSTADVLV